MSNSEPTDTASGRPEDVWEGDERPRDPRRLARELALTALYEADAVGHPPGEALQRQLEAEPAPPSAEKRARELLAGVQAHREAIDARIHAAAPNWPLEQMAPVDKGILRVALFEILFNNSRVPLKAAISEAVELAKRFGSDSSPRFVNGVLSSIATQARTASEAEPATGPTGDPRSTETEYGRER